MTDKKVRKKYVFRKMRKGSKFVDASGITPEIKEKIKILGEKSTRAKIHEKTVLHKCTADELKEIVKPHVRKMIYTDHIKNEVYDGTVKINITLELKGKPFSTSVSLKKNIVALWIVMMDKTHLEYYRVIQDFVENVCIKRWQGTTCRGMGDFIVKCMIHSMLEKEDYEAYKSVYLSLTHKVKHKMSKQKLHFLPLKERPKDLYKKIDNPYLKGV